MKLLKINKLLNDLNNNKIIAMPTETVYGFFSLISLENLKNINKLKGRELEKPLQVFFLDFSQIEKYTKLSQFQKQILIQELPGNKSFLVPSSSFFKKLTNQNTILIRLPI
jgi:tRNA A37 threonylcarbamoyladenosine synthetase subunit TsaC/SUA5/YrdC